MFGQKLERPDAGVVDFHPLSELELSARMGGTGFTLAHLSIGPKHKTYACGACGNTTNGRVVCEAKRRADNAQVLWCWCSCDKAEPTIIVEKDGEMLTHLPTAREFRSASDWPTDLASLYDEAAKAYAAGANTAAVMVCRKLLMACACNKGEKDDKTFAAYVDYITTSVLTYPDAKNAIDAIRTIGNEANHEVKIVNPADATRAMKIVTYMLNTIYSLPAA